MMEYKGAHDQVIFQDVLDAVSYTHLDVYKRQELMNAVNKALDEFVGSDKYNELKEKWGA